MAKVALMKQKYGFKEAGSGFASLRPFHKDEMGSKLDSIFPENHRSR